MSGQGERGVTGATEVGIVRSAARLESLRYGARPGAGDAPWWRVEPYCERVPLSPGERPELWEAWRALAAVTAWDETTLGHVLAVLRATVPCADPPGELPALGPEVQPPPPPRATAAHPRAFRGTKYQPPKAARPAVDLRPYLLARRHIDQILELLGQPRGSDPYAAWNHGGAAGGGLEPMFVTYVLPILRGRAWSEVAAFASLARSLELHARPELRAAVGNLCVAIEDPTHALGWWSHILAHEPARRVEVAGLVTWSNATGSVSAPLDAELGALLVGLSTEQLWACYRGLAEGASPAYLRSGLALGVILATKPEAPPPGRADLTLIVAVLVERLAAAMETDSGPDFWRGHLWRLCGRFPALIELIESQVFAVLEPRAAFELLRLTVHASAVPSNERPVRWRRLAPQLWMIAETAAGVPVAYQRRVVCQLGDACAATLDDGHDPAVVVARALAPVLRTARPPFDPEASLSWVLLELALLRDADDAHRAALCAAPDASWRALEDVCRRDHGASLLARGIERLMQRRPAFVREAFAAAPAALCETASILAALSKPAAVQLLGELAEAPLEAADLEAASLEALCRIVEPIARAGGPNPVRRALRMHLAGEATLSEAQLRGHRARILEELPSLRLAAIRQAAERVLAGRVGRERIETPAGRHAALLLSSAGLNRRGLRRLVTATLAGDRDWKVRHPRSQEWLARHPKLHRDVWLAGIEHRVELAGLGEVCIAVEADPLEALKLGTYVGSCLARGGACEGAAAANVLDVNKQVVYARDAKGAVVARQLLAISEADELVCFAVYGAAKPAVIEPPFRAYDRAFAEALGLPLFAGAGGADDYEITNVLSHDWWDDSAWLPPAS